MPRAANITRIKIFRLRRCPVVVTKKANIDRTKVRLHLGRCGIMYVHSRGMTSSKLRSDKAMPQACSYRFVAKLCRSGYCETIPGATNFPNSLFPENSGVALAFQAKWRLFSAITETLLRTPTKAVRDVSRGGHLRFSILFHG